MARQIRQKRSACADLAETSRRAPLTDRPTEIEIDLGSSMAAPAWSADRSIEVFARFENPCDFERTGAALRIEDARENAFMDAEIADTLQRNGTRLSHSIGYLRPADVAWFATATALGLFFSVSLWELQSEGMVPSGATLTFSPTASQDSVAPLLQLRFGNHDLGVLRGHTLEQFLECLRLRCATAEAA
jgi:hypothetical protein